MDIARNAQIPEILDQIKGKTVIIINQYNVHITVIAISPRLGKLFPPFLPSG
jgi:hypothetical protein